MRTATVVACWRCGNPIRGRATACADCLHSREWTREEEDVYSLAIHGYYVLGWFGTFNDAIDRARTWAGAQPTPQEDATARELRRAHPTWFAQ